MMKCPGGLQGIILIILIIMIRVLLCNDHTADNHDDKMGVLVVTRRARGNRRRPTLPKGASSYSHPHQHPRHHPRHHPCHHPRQHPRHHPRHHPCHHPRHYPRHHPRHHPRNQYQHQHTRCCNQSHQSL